MKIILKENTQKEIRTSQFIVWRRKLLQNMIIGKK